MQPDYNQLWHNLNNSQTTDAQFYTFFEDSLNRFISTNSNSSEAAISDTSEQPYKVEIKSE